MKQVQEEGLQLFAKKNKDYRDSFVQFGPIGVIIRIQDKINRLANITKKNITLLESESLRDILIDLHNYSAMAIILLDEENIKKVESENNVGNEKIVQSESIGHALYLEDNGLDDGLYNGSDNGVACWGQFA